ncbi:glycosyltransferase family 4 protein [Rhizobium tropici]|uniref:Glycosyltransferase family 1 protein n=1 Tax=Rhizobium tropici TaxID=398 RepID=A0A329YL45_RHITR|nr:glycosyltransferase family 1 protein [Rhizobium tropici]RAX41985.1 glycosyltransferase family 1 protein [Rhizobium tropici]
MRIGVDARNLVPEMSGLGRYVSEMVRHLAAGEHRIYLYLPEPPKVAIPDHPNVVVRFAKAHGGLARTIWAQTVLPMSVRRDEIDLFWGPAHRLPQLLDRRIARVVTIHDLAWRHAAATMRFRSRLADRYFMRPAVQLADRVIADSRATAEQLAAEYPGIGRKVRVVYPGLTPLDVGSTVRNALEAFNIDRPFVLFVGTLEPRKNLTNLLKAYALLDQALRNNLLLVVAGGQGWKLGSLKEQISALGVSSSVRLTGYVSDEQLASLYANAKFLAMPSFYEGFGFPIIEANSKGIPVLTSNRSAMPEVAGNAALLVNPANANEISNAMTRLATDTKLQANLASAGPINAARFQWDKSASALLEIFQEAIGKRK